MGIKVPHNPSHIHSPSKHLYSQTAQIQIHIHSPSKHLYSQTAQIQIQLTLRSFYADTSDWYTDRHRFTYLAACSVSLTCILSEVVTMLKVSVSATVLMYTQIYNQNSFIHEKSCLFNSHTFSAESKCILFRQLKVVSTYLISWSSLNANPQCTCMQVGSALNAFSSRTNFKRPNPFSESLNFVNKCTRHRSGHYLKAECQPFLCQCFYKSSYSGFIKPDRWTYEEYDTWYNFVRIRH